MDKFLESISTAEKSLRTADHMAYVTFPLLKDKRLLLKIAQEIKKVISTCINSILQREYLYKRISIYKDSKENFRTFTEKSASRYDITREEVRLIKELFDFIKKHKESPFEFIKDDKVIILSNEMQPATLSLEKIKEFLLTAKDILKKTKGKILGKS